MQSRMGLLGSRPQKVPTLDTGRLVTVLAAEAAEARELPSLCAWREPIPDPPSKRLGH